MRISLFSWLFFIPICSLLLNFGIFVVSGQCIDDQRTLLIELKNSLNFNSTKSTKLVRWDKTQTPNCCSWAGVNCSDVGNIIGLNLNNETIWGGLNHSSSLFRLQYLQNLNLAYNNFNSSRIPPEFGNLTNLIYLNLSTAGFAEQIPIEISRLTRLVTLDLSANYYFSTSLLKIENPNLATLVQNLSELEELYLDGVNISAQGNEWCQAISSSLPNLRVLSMSDCNLSRPLDSSLQNLPFLSIIRLDNNKFFAPVPELFANFTNLTSLHLSSCGLNGSFPEKIFQVQTLQTLDLSNNGLLYGSLPEFHPNGSLRSLLLSGTKFSGALPDSIGNLKMLSKIDLSFCNFSGSIPSSMENLTQLVYLDLSSNNFNGSVPPFSMAKNLTQINLSRNYLTGQITSTHGKDLPNLVNLDLSFNSLNGSIPVSLFSLPSLQKLQLSNNRFSGLLNEFSNVFSSAMDTLDLSSNKLEGSIPTSVFELRGLKILLLSSNNFSGSFQLNKIQQLRNLSNLDLSYNSLLIDEYNGTNSSLPPISQITTIKLASCNLSKIPNFLRNQSRLNYLDLSNNQIQEAIPGWIWKLRNLFYLNLSYNHLGMTLEGALLNLSSLTVLDLHSNQLEGGLPVLPPFATYLDFSDNKFNSTIPASIGNCGLQTLNLNGNLLEGVVPRSLANCTNLEVFDIGNNHIKDAFPCYLSNISRLRVLVLRSNKFHGAIGCKGPNATWPMLQIVDLASNSFTGQLRRESLSAWKAMMDETPSKLSYLKFDILQLNPFYYHDVITVTFKGLDIELVKILTIFTSIDVSNNNLDGPIPKELGELKSLLVLNLSHNAFIGHIPQSLGNLTMLESLDLSSNKLTGEIPVQLGRWSYFPFIPKPFVQSIGGADSIIQAIFYIFKSSYEGNKGLCGFILTGLGFGVGAAVVVAPLMFWEKGRKWHDDSIDKVLLVILPMIGLSYTGCNNFKVEAEEDIEDENTDDCEDDDDDDEMEDEEFRGRPDSFSEFTPERGDENRTWFR
uniref:Leucine-rich repeat-containing N-terminal plant-type domain-containing protein n=1 Tax=Fagus sylvatica TaxID=28930 RepID=A0A2N9G6A4_FAGSY